MRELQQLPVAKITPFYIRFSRFSSSTFKSCFRTFSAVTQQEPVSSHRHLSFHAFSPHFCESSGKPVSV